MPLETWREICQATIQQARAGAPKARAWLALYLLGSSPMPLLHLAADERAAYSAEDDIEREVQSRKLARLLGGACAHMGRKGTETECRPSTAAG